VPQTNTLGNAPRFNTLARRPSNLNENILVQKSFSLTEHVRLDFRWEVFNILNQVIPGQVILGPPDTNITSQTLGRITNAGSPRQMQFGLKLYF
jgi:hypothetical protein